MNNAYRKCLIGNSMTRIETLLHAYLGWLCFTSYRQRGYLETTPHLLSLANDVKLGFKTVTTGNRTPGYRVAVHYTTTAPRQLHCMHILAVVLLRYFCNSGSVRSK